MYLSLYDQYIYIIKPITYSTGTVVVNNKYDLLILLVVDDSSFQPLNKQIICLQLNYTEASYSYTELQGVMGMVGESNVITCSICKANRVNKT